MFAPERIFGKHAGGKAEVPGTERALSDYLESLIGDCCGPNSAFEQTRQQLSSYAWDHYGDLDPAEAGGEPRPGSMLRRLEASLKAADFGQAVRLGPTQSPARAGPMNLWLFGWGGHQDEALFLG